MRCFFYFVMIVIFWLLGPAIHAAADCDQFIHTRSARVNMRVGPGIYYPVKSVYRVKGLPLRYRDRFDDWIAVEDFEGNVGWIYKNMISTKMHYAIVPVASFATTKRNNNDKISMQIEANSIVSVDKCKNDFCLIKVNKHKGWIAKSDLWGVE